MDDVISRDELGRIKEWLRAVAGLCESQGVNHEALVELIGKGAQGILDRLSPNLEGEK